MKYDSVNMLLALINYYHDRRKKKLIAGQIS